MWNNYLTNPPIFRTPFITQIATLAITSARILAEAEGDITVNEGANNLDRLFPQLCHVEISLSSSMIPFSILL